MDSECHSNPGVVCWCHVIVQMITMFWLALFARLNWELLVSIRLFQHLEDVRGNGSLVWPVSLMHNFYSERLVLLSLKT